MDQKRIALLGSLCVCLIILVFIFFRSSGKENIKTPSLPSSPVLEEQSTIPVETKTIALFFLSEKDHFLHPEERKIPADVSMVQQARQTIKELLKGSQNGYISPFPPETELREFFLTREGVAYVDFSKDILEKHLCGSSAEISMIFAAVNSLTYNFESIKRVFILIDGRERETMGGHIDLSRPFLPQYDLIAN